VEDEEQNGDGRFLQRTTSEGLRQRMHAELLPFRAG
jgi:hypothetical protein